MNKKIYDFNKYKIELIIPDKSKDLSFSKINNINIYDENNIFICNISELLEIYSNINGLKYYEDMYFEIRKLENHHILCIGFINHCEIDLKTLEIIKLINNR